MNSPATQIAAAYRSTSEETTVKGSSALLVAFALANTFTFVSVAFCPTIFWRAAWMIFSASFEPAPSSAMVRSCRRHQLTLDKVLAAGPWAECSHHNVLDDGHDGLEEVRGRGFMWEDESFIWLRW
jgi:hypothetical protein